MHRSCFFFQAEDGIRDGHVTGVQTCALPILAALCVWAVLRWTNLQPAYFSPALMLIAGAMLARAPWPSESYAGDSVLVAGRSEERRVGKGGMVEVEEGALREDTRGDTGAIDE